MVPEENKDGNSDRYKPSVKLVGEDGNVFSIIGRVSGALRREGMRDEANEFTRRAFASKSYDDVLTLAMEYCEVI